MDHLRGDHDNAPGEVAHHARLPSRTTIGTGAARPQPPPREALLDRCRPDLVAFVEARLDPKVRARIDPSDVVQEAQLEVARRLEDFLGRRPMPFHLWVRKTAYERLLNLRSCHRASGRRSVDREQALPEHSSLALARALLAGAPSPSQHLQAREFAERISLAVAKLREADREVLLMRQVEALPYEEVACLLGLTPAAARQRYGRALLKLRQVLKESGLLEG
jgi:RNA polymerase sigma-70 factor (ECF subfamily)